METMKSMFFACALLLGSAETFSAENLVLREDFESQTFPPSGWVVKGTELSEDLESGYAHWSLNWNEVTGCSIAGSGCAEVMSDFKEGQAGISKEESGLLLLPCRLLIMRRCLLLFGVTLHRL